MWLMLALRLALDLASILKAIEDPALREGARKDLLRLARSGEVAAQWQAVVLSRKGQLPRVSPRQVERWSDQAVERAVPEACLAAARSEIKANREAEPLLRCAAAGALAEAEYLLGLSILKRIAAEDEGDRFEGLAWVALAAQAGYGAGTRRWEILVSGLTAEDLERVEQKTKALRSPR